MFDRLGVVGLTWRSGGSRALARFTLPVEDRVTRLRELADRAATAELVYLATCNRVEVAFLGDGERDVGAYRRLIFTALAGREPKPGEAERTLRAWVGEGAMEHLFLVAAGLDSAQLGEREIRGQLKEAVEVAERAQVCGRLLREAFDEALKVARRVHRQTEVGSGRTSLAEIALDAVRRRLDEDPRPLAVVGVSPMTRYCAQMLASDGRAVVVVNRTVERAEELAREVSGKAYALDAFCRAPADVGAIVLATAAPTALLTASVLRRLADCGSPLPLLVDMAVPGDVDEDAAGQVGYELLTMDGITELAEVNRERRREEMASAREEVDSALAELRRRLAERWVSPVVASLSQRYQQTALEGVERLLRQGFANASEADRAAVERWAKSLARRFAHIPVLGLRALASEAGPAAVETFLAASDDPLAEEFVAALRSLPEPSLEDVET